MFELRSDIPLPSTCVYPWSKMKIGQCLVFTDDEEYEAAVVSAKGQKKRSFLCEDKKIWLVSQKAEAPLQPKILKSLTRNGELSYGVLRNRFRDYTQKRVDDALGALLAKNKIKARDKHHGKTKRAFLVYSVK